MGHWINLLYFVLPFCCKVMHHKVLEVNNPIIQWLKYQHIKVVSLCDHHHFILASHYICITLSLHNPCILDIFCRANLQCFNAKQNALTHQTNMCMPIITIKFGTQNGRPQFSQPRIQNMIGKMFSNILYAYQATNTYTTINTSGINPPVLKHMLFRLTLNSTSSM